MVMVKCMFPGIKKDLVMYFFMFICVGLFKISKETKNIKEIEENILDGNKNYEMLKLMKDSCAQYILERFITILYVFCCCIVVLPTLTLIFLFLIFFARLAYFIYYRYTYLLIIVSHSMCAYYILSIILYF